MKKKGHIYVSVFLIAVAGYAIYSASQWSFKTGFFPLAIAIPLIILALIGGPAVEAEFADEVSPEVARRRAIAIFSWIVAFILSVYLLGFPLTVPLFLFFYLKLQSQVSWPRSLTLTIVSWGGFYALFQRLVRLQFETGVIQTWLGL